MDLDVGAHLRSLLETELTVANDNYTYPNTTLDVRHLQSSFFNLTMPLKSCACLLLHKQEFSLSQGMERSNWNLSV